MLLCEYCADKYTRGVFREFKINYRPTISDDDPRLFLDCFGVPSVACEECRETVARFKIYDFIYVR